MPKINRQVLALCLLALASVALLSAIGWRWYRNKQDYFQSGAPPQEIMDRIEPKKVPYDQIKPPAFLQTDSLVFGSISSTVGIAFYGDYTNNQSNSLAYALESWSRKMGGRIRFVWHYLPASTDDNSPSFEAAMLSECSRLIDSSWKAHGLMVKFSNLGQKEINFLSDQLADKDGMLYGCLQDKSLRSYVRQKVQVARGDGIDNAPFVFVGTQAFPAQTASTTSIIRSAQAYLKY